MNGNAHFDKDQIKQAAAGRWTEIISSICGLTPDQMEDRHQPCPRCGGADRYRAFRDFAETGGVFCNQCHAKNNQDGLATIEWMKGVDLDSAVELVANYLGIKPSGKKKSGTAKPPADPAKGLEFMAWSPILAALFCGVKQGVTEESLLAQGCQMARYKNMTVIVWPIIGPDLDTDKPVGYVIMEHKCRPIPVYNRKGEVVDHVEKKVVAGSKPGFIGKHAIEAMKNTGQVELVWKCEGLTDQATTWAAVPEHLRGSHVVISTANGAQENPKWQADILANFNTLIAHDADEPGQAGAEKWALAIAGRVADGKYVKNVPPPYDIQPKKGKDYRDFYNEGNTYTDALNLAAKAEAVVVARNEDGTANEAQQRFPIHAMLMERLQVEILDEDESGTIRIYSRALNKISKVTQICHLKQESLIQMCGPLAVGLISDEPDYEETFDIKTVRQAIALAAAGMRKADRQGGATAILARLISVGQHFAKNERDHLFRYSEGCYRPDGNEFVKRRVKEISEDISNGIEWTSRRAPEVLAYLLATAPQLDDDPSPDLLNVKNGIVRLRDLTLIEHSPKQLTSLQLPVTYDPQATCPRVDKFVGEVFPEDSQHIAVEIFSLLMAPDYSIQKAILLLGPGGDGKSTFLRLIQEFLGSTNCSSVSLHDLEDNRFARSQLVGKLANINADLPTEDLQGTSIFKALTGGDMMTGEDKGKPHFQFRPFAKLVFSTNSPPRSRDASDGFYDRWIIIPFCNQFRSTSRCIPQAQLISELTAPRELSGLLNKAVAVRHKIVSAGAISVTDSMLHAHNEFRATTDPFAVWLDCCTSLDPDAVVPKEKLRTAYGESCATAGRPRLSENLITRQLKRLRPHVKSVQRTISGQKGVWCYSGIRLVDTEVSAQVYAQVSHNSTDPASNHSDLKSGPEIDPAQQSQLFSESTPLHLEEEKESADEDSYIREKKRNGDKVVKPVHHSNGTQVDSANVPNRKIITI